MDEATEYENPFPGLRSFEPEEGHLFFGRDGQVTDLLQLLDRTRFLSVVGTSGSGKSSLVRSGLIPSLYGGYISKAGSSWRVAILRPGEDPIKNLARALNDPEVLGEEGNGDGGEMQRALIESTLRRSARGLAEAVRQAELPDYEALLVLADQFEELFRFKNNRQRKDSRQEAFDFVRLLLEASKDEGVKVYVVLTMRSEYIGPCTEFPGLTEAINAGQYLVPRMTREERREAIAGPVAVGDAEITPRLVLRLLNDVGDDPDQLPVLQHSMMRAWDYWARNHSDGEALDLRHYEAIGRMEKALSIHADDAYWELEKEGLGELTAKLFKALTEGSDVRGIRRPLSLAQAAEVTEADAKDVVRVAECFRAPGRSFLMPSIDDQETLTPESILDISHESLMRKWERLIDWVADEARAAETYKRLAEDAKLYQVGKAALYHGPELQIASQWNKDKKPTSAWAQRYDPSFERALLFLEKSEGRERDRIEREEEKRQRDLRRARRLTMIFGALTILFLLMGLFITNLWNGANTAKKLAEDSAEDARIQKDLAEKSAEDARIQKGIADGNAEEALRLQRLADGNAEEAMRQKALADANAERALRQEGIAKEEREEAMRQKKKADGNAEEAMRQKKKADENAEEAQRQKKKAEELRIVAEARSLAGQTTRLLGEDQRDLAALLSVVAYRLNEEFRDQGVVEDDRDIHHDALWKSLGRLDKEQGPGEKAQMSWGGFTDAVRSIAFAARGKRRLAAGSDDGLILLVDAESKEEEIRLRLPSHAGVRALAFDARGARLAAGGDDGSIAVWKVSALVPGPPEGNPGKALPRVHERVVNALAWSPGGGSMASAGSDGKLALWEEPSPGKPATRVYSTDELKAACQGQGEGGKVTAVAWLAKQRLAAATTHGVVTLKTGRTPRCVNDSPKNVQALSASEDRLAGGTEDAMIALWEIGRRLEEVDRPPLTVESNSPLQGHEGAITALAIAGGSLASASLDRRVEIWSVKNPELAPIKIEDHQEWVRAVALSHDGKLVASGGQDRRLRLTPTEPAEIVDLICEHPALSSPWSGLEEKNEYLPVSEDGEIQKRIRSTSPCR